MRIRIEYIEKIMGLLSGWLAKTAISNFSRKSSFYVPILVINSKPDRYSFEISQVVLSAEKQ